MNDKQAWATDRRAASPTLNRTAQQCGIGAKARALAGFAETAMDDPATITAQTGCTAIPTWFASQD